MKWKMCLIVGAALVACAFLLGFVPQYEKKKAVDKQLVAVQQQLNVEREKSQMDELGLLCGRIYLELDSAKFSVRSGALVG